MDAQAMLIGTLIAHTDKELVEATKNFHPLVNLVYMEFLPKKYKHPTFTTFDGGGNLRDHITIY